MNEAAVGPALDRAGWTGRRRERAAGALLRPQPQTDEESPGSQSPGVPAPGLVGPALMTVGGYLVGYVAFVLTWRSLGADVYSGSDVRPGFLLPLLLTVAGAVVGHHGAARLGLSVGLRLRRRLLDAVLEGDPDRLRHSGLGGLFALALDADLVAAGLMSAAPVVLPAVIELVVALGVLAVGAGALPSIGAIVAGLGALGVTVAVSARLRHRCSVLRTELSARLVERLLGHRTVLVQEDADVEARWAAATEHRYAARARALDAVESALGAYPLLSLAGVVLVAGSSGAGAQQVAISIGGGLLAASALTRLTFLIPPSAQAWVAWRSLQPLMRTQPVPRQPANDRAPDDPTLQVSLRGAAFDYPDGSGGVREVAMDVRRGDRILLTGPSGSGKTTVASLLAGTRRTTTGQRHLSPGTRVVFVPQSGDNHIFRGSLLTNVLLERWPPTPADVAAAEAVLESLGLGQLVGRMPAGLTQPVGEAGWRLSDGETSRIQLARALLARPDVLILDESFGALDPRTVQDVCAVAEAGAPTLIVIAHP